MKFFITLFASLLICTQAFAVQTIKIICDQNESGLDNLFIANKWVRDSMPWYSSYAQEFMGAYSFTGGMRTIKDQYPKDPSPHLHFMKPAIDYDDERGEIIMCRYKIGNTEMMDIDNVLEMRSILYLPKDSCYVSSFNTITCISK